MFFWGSSWCSSMENNSWNYWCSLDGSTPQLHFSCLNSQIFLWISEIPDKQGFGLVFKHLQQSQNSHFGSFFSVYMESKMQNFPFPPTLGILPSQKCSVLSWDHSFPLKFPPQNFGIIYKPHKLGKKSPKTAAALIVQNSKSRRGFHAKKIFLEEFAPDLIHKKNVKKCRIGAAGSKTSALIKGVLLKLGFFQLHGICADRISH